MQMSSMTRIQAKLSAFAFNCNRMMFFRITLLVFNNFIYLHL